MPKTKRVELKVWVLWCHDVDRLASARTYAAWQDAFDAVHGHDIGATNCTVTPATVVVEVPDE